MKLTGLTTTVTELRKSQEYTAVDSWINAPRRYPKKQAERTRFPFTLVTVILALTIAAVFLIKYR